MDIYDRLKQAQDHVVDELECLAGNRVADAAWQDVAGTAALALRRYADLLDSLRRGEMSGTVTFPCLADSLDP